MSGKNKKNIIFVIPSLKGGGAEKILTELLRNLDRDLFNLELVTFTNEGNYLNLIPGDVSVVNLAKKSAMDSLRLVFAIYRILKKENPDLLVSSLTYANYVCAIAKYFSRSKVPIILTEHSVLSESIPTERFSHIKKKILRYFYPKADCLVTVSQGSKKELVNSFVVPANKIVVIHNGIDIDLTLKLGKEDVDHPWFREDIPILISVGRLTKLKNFPLILKAIHSLKDKLYFRFVMLGEGEERHNLEAMAKELGISDRVSFLEFQNNPYKYVSKSTLFVLSSFWENFPVVVLEAMCLKVPVISTDYTFGHGEMIENNLTGLIVPNGNADALAEAILLLLKDESLRCNLAEAASIRVNDFVIGNMVKKYESTFEEIIEKVKS